MANVSPSVPPAERDGTGLMVTIAVVVAALYFGREVFIPIALAILLSFVLAPGVRRLHALGLGRVFPVLFTTLLAFTVIFAVFGVLGSQLRDLAGELPRYESTITRKITTLRSATKDGVMQRVEDVLAKLNRAATRSLPQQPAGPETAPAPRQPLTEGVGPGVATQQPVLVEIRQQAPTSIETITALLGPLVHPLATAGIVVIFVLFILMQREDLRNRLIRLFGASDLQRTTAAINDGGKRLSRYLLSQLAVNAVSGVVIGAVAFAVGVPNPVLWGILFALMRFIPYIGPIIGGALPVIFAAAVDTGWGMALWLAAIILAIELAIGQVVEPLLYGHNTGLSPVAVVVAATFWTALWGPIGLLLATPLTVCLVVIGRHVEQLAFLDVLLGDRPPLTAAETFYQRMLANDPTEVSDRAEECLRSMSLLQYYDDVMLPGLLLAQADVSADRLSLERQVQIRDATDDVNEDLDDEAGASQVRGRFWHLLRLDRSDADHDSAVDAAEPIPPVWRHDGAVLCIGSRGPLDDSAATMLAQILRKRGIGAREESFEMLSKSNIDRLDTRHTRLICMSCLDGSSSAYLRFALRRVRRKAPHVKLLIGAWWMQAEDSRSQTVHLEDNRPLTEPSATTIVDAARYCLAAASALSEHDLGVRLDPEPDELSRAS